MKNDQKKKGILIIRLIVLLFLTGYISTYAKTSVYISELTQKAAADEYQTKKVTGTVTDAATGEALPGVTVRIEGTGKGTVADQSGQYSIEIQNENAILVFSFVGYKTISISAYQKQVLDVQLTAETSALEEVVVIGYGTQTKRAVTASTSTVSAEEIHTVNALSVDNILQGKASGLQVSNYTAQPGGNSSISIRGALSPNGSNSPLYVIDGLPILNNSSVENSGIPGIEGQTDRNPLNSINPSDIESISILKDASATAIYGSAAANGVILISTKRGSVGKTTVNFSSTYSFVTRKENYLEPLNDHDFKFYHEKFKHELYLANNGLGIYGNTDPSTVAPYVPTFSQAEIVAAGAGTNYLDYVLRDGRILDNNISIQGGNSGTRFFTSFNYFKQDGLIKESGLKKYSFRVNLDQKIGSIIDLKINLAYSEIYNQNQNTGQQRGGTEASSVIQSGLSWGPGLPLVDENGNLTRSYNPRIDNPNSYFEISNNSEVQRLTFSPNIQVNIAKGIKVNFVGGLDQNVGNTKIYVPVAANFVYLPDGYGRVDNNNVRNYSSEGYLTLDKAISDHSFTVIAGGGYYKTESIGDGFYAEGFPTDAFGVDNLGIASIKEKINISTYRWDRTKISQFGRINYSYKNKYILTFNERFDGSSIWAEGNKWGFFPGISAAWIVSDEPFLNNKAINLLKIRGGYGTVGNEGLGGNYALSLYGSGWRYAFGYPSKVYQGVLQTQLGNSNIRWETDITANAGIDFGFFNNRITGSVEYFWRTAKDLFDYQTLPSANAMGRTGANIGSTRSRGFELELQSQNTVGQLMWTTNLTLSNYKSFWIERNPEVKLAEYIKKNDPIHAVYGWKTDGLIKSREDVPDHQPLAYPGNKKYIDSNNDGIMNIKDVQYLGNYDPKLIYGFGNNLVYKNFDLNIFITGTLGGWQYDYWPGNMWGFTLNSPYNVDKHVLDTWSSFNTNGKYPGVAPNGTTSNPSGNDDYLGKNIFWGRVRNITLGYNLPGRILGKSVQALRVYADLQNLIVFGNYGGMDPEMERNNMPYPTAVTTAFGINVTF